MERRITEIGNAAVVCAFHHRLLDQGWRTRMTAGIPGYRASGSDTW